MPAMSAPCRATMRVGDPDDPSTVVCHRTAHADPDADHYDAAEQMWWRPLTGDEPELHRPAPGDASP